MRSAHRRSRRSGGLRLADLHDSIYRTPYDDDEVIALFTTESNARRVCEAWASDTREDEEVVVRDSNAALSAVKFFG